MAFGLLLLGEGQSWADDLTVEVVDPREVKSTQLIQYGAAPVASASNLGFEATDPGNPLPGWSVHGHGPRSYGHRIAEAGAHGGRAFLQARSTEEGVPTAFSAA